MNADVIVVTCSEPDALPFLLSLPRADLAKATLVATGDVVRCAERQTVVTTTRIIDGLGCVAEIRGLVRDSSRNMVVIVAPDPWGPIHGKGFVRARLLAPWFMSPGSRADLIELRSGGRSHRVVPDFGHTALMVRLYSREALFLTEDLARRSVASPVGHMAAHVSLSRVSLPRALFRAILVPPLAAATLARLIPFILWTEARARMKGRQR